MSEPNDDGRYKVSPDGDGSIREVYDTTTHSKVPLDASSSAFCDFLDWAASEQTRREMVRAPLLPNAVHLCSVKAVVDYFKRERRVLATTRGEGSVPRILSGTNDPEARGRLTCPVNVAIGPTDPDQQGQTQNVLRFYPLYEAVVSVREGEEAADDGFASRPLPVLVSQPAHDELGSLLADANSEVRWISDVPIDRTFVYVDISGFSKNPQGRQLAILNALISLANSPHDWEGTYARDAVADREASLCIGDGYIFVFRRPSCAVYFAAKLANLIEYKSAKERLLEFHFRMGVNTGPVHRFVDSIGSEQERWNYVGKGITDGQRVLAAIGTEVDDVIYISGETRRHLMAGVDLDYDKLQVADFLINRGRREDKHGTMRRVYELNHAAWMGGPVARDIRA